MIEEYQNVKGSAIREAKNGGSRPIKDPVLTMSTRLVYIFIMDTIVADGVDFVCEI